MWSTSIVHIDDSLRWQKRLGHLADHQLWLPAEGLKYLCENTRFVQVGESLATLPPGLVFLGGSSFHHLSLHLIRQCSNRQPVKLCVFDRHLDLFPTLPEHVSCGSWLRLALELSRVQEVLLLGPDLPPESRSFLGERREKALATKLKWAPLESAEEVLKAFCASAPHLYVSIDKDVLAEVRTDWGEGRLSPDALLSLLEQAKTQAILVGADVCGELVPRGPWPDDLELAQIHHNEEINLAIRDVLCLGSRVARSQHRLPRVILWSQLRKQDDIAYGIKTKE